jgi:hypothetical protein
VFDCLSFLTTYFLKTTKEKNPVKKHPAIKKIKKKEAKISYRYSVKQVQALRVFKKISTLSGSIFLKKLVFLKPSTWTNGFLFFSFFSFEKIL